LIILPMFGKEYKLRSSSLWSFLQPRLVYFCVNFETTVLAQYWIETRFSYILSSKSTLPLFTYICFKHHGVWVCFFFREFRVQGISRWSVYEYLLYPSMTVTYILLYLSVYNPVSDDMLVQCLNDILYAGSSKRH
jgi:hypothetical protein